MESSPQVTAMVSNMSGGVVGVGGSAGGGGGVSGGAIGVVSGGGVSAAVVNIGNNNTNIMNKVSVSGKDIVSYKTDHLYCHNNDTNYLQRTNITAAPIPTSVAGSDIMSLMKETKHLKGMLMLHLDLIQEQSHQIMAKDKQINKLKQEIVVLNAELEEQSAVVTAMLNRGTDTDQSNDDVDDVCSNSESIVVKEEIMSPEASRDIDIMYDKEVVKENGQIINEIVATDEKAILKHATNSNAKTLPPISFESKQESQEVNFNKQELVIKLEKGIFQSVAPRPVEPVEKVTSTTKSIEYTDTINDEPIIPKKANNSTKMPQKINNKKPDDELPPLVPFLSNSRKTPTTTTTANSSQIRHHEKKRESQSTTVKDHQNTSGRNTNKTNSESTATFMTTSEFYCSREWIIASTPSESDVECNEQNGITATANLEIPSWTVKECHGLYTIEGTEDLSDEQFNKRHQRYEHDERRRKKWDVQRIREQRTIERLKRRHCKEVEVVDDGKETEGEMRSFYPPLDSVRFIELTEELPVQAFGELIPVLGPSDFVLPWRANATTAGSAGGSKTQARNANHETADTAALSCSAFVWTKTTPAPTRRPPAASSGNAAGGAVAAAAAANNNNNSIGGRTLRRASAAVQPKGGNKRCKR